MPSLAELQQRFCAAVINGVSAPLPVRGHGLTAGQRLQVYRNMAGSLFLEALQTSFPAVQGLVGEAFFEQAAQAYLSMHPSSSGNLQGYGARFPAFLERLPETRELAYLGDVARLEWARQETYLAADAPQLDEAAFAAAIGTISGDVRLALHPALRLVHSSHRIFDIWLYCQEPGGEAPALAGSAQNVLLWRDAGQVAMQPVDDAAAAFLASLAEGQSLSAAAGAACALQSGFDAGAWLALLLHRRLITAISRIHA